MIVGWPCFFTKANYLFSCTWKALTYFDLSSSLTLFASWRPLKSFSKLRTSTFNDMQNCVWRFACYVQVASSGVCWWIYNPAAFGYCTRFVCRLHTLNCLAFACGSNVLTSKQNTGSICHYLSRILLSMFWRVALQFFKKWPSPASLCTAVRFLTTPQPIGVGTRWALEVGIFSGAWGPGDLQLGC
jgi:hypothetical protein